MAPLGGPTTLAPRSFFEDHCRKPYAFFLDHAGASRPSFAGSVPSQQLVVEADASVRQWRSGRWELSAGDPVTAIARFVDESRCDPIDVPDELEEATLPRTVGYLAYELGAHMDGPRRRGSVGRDGPLALLSTYDEIDCWDPRRERPATVRFAASRQSPVPPSRRDAGADRWRSSTRDEYALAFARLREAIAAGDIYQANLSRRAVFAVNDRPWDAYLRLREVQPVPHGAYLDCGGFALLSNSPECFLSRRDQRVVTRPIKGTRSRGADAGGDRARVAELRRDAKEAAEHLMIVDLERNDLGRVASVGSVTVERFAEVETFATVHHLVSDVSATLRAGVGLEELLRATFPGGSITGAPKIRAMELLAEVEDQPRGPYTGAIGYFCGSERFELAIAIRTAVVAGGVALYSSGGGIVADSDLDREWEETETKLAAWRRALSPLHSSSAALA